MLIKLQVEVESIPWVRNCPMALRTTVATTGAGAGVQFHAKPCNAILYHDVPCNTTNSSIQLRSIQKKIAMFFILFTLRQASSCCRNSIQWAQSLEFWALHQWKILRFLSHKESATRRTLPLAGHWLWRNSQSLCGKGYHQKQGRLLWRKNPQCWDPNLRQVANIKRENV